MCSISEPDDYCQVWNWTARTARKTHRCDCCGGTIRPGERYSVLHSLYDGHWDTEKMCVPCDAAEREFGAAHGDISLSPSGFAQALRECVDEEDPEDARWLPVLEAMRARAGGVAA